MNGHLTILQNCRTTIDTLVNEFCSGFQPNDVLGSAIKTALEGGKRFRPVLVFLVADALKLGGEPIAPALAVEFFHTASLIADDLPCMDNDDERRGKPALHKTYGEATALLATYALIAEGYHQLSRFDADISDTARIRAIEIVSRNTGYLGATGGQFLDLFPPDQSVETIHRVIHQKTVSLFEIAFSLGWIYGRGALDEDSLGEIQKIALHYGMAFQIADDFEDEAQDIAHDCRVNLVLALGREAAYAQFEAHIEQYKNSLQRLRIASEAMLDIAGLLEANISLHL